MPQEFLPAKKNISIFDEEDKLQKNELNIHHQYALRLHASFFKDAKGEYTLQSIEAGLLKLGVSSALAYLTALFFMAEARLSGCPCARLCGGGSFSRSELALLIHPFDTGIFKKENGAFDQEAFDRLKGYAIEDKKTGQHVISSRELRAYIDNNSHHDERWKDASYKKKLIGYMSTAGEFMLLFRVLSDANINGTRYITLSRLKRFFTDGYTLFQEISAAKKFENQTRSSSSYLKLFQPLAKPLVVCAAVAASIYLLPR